MTSPEPLAHVRALLFDVFGTVYDWLTPVTTTLEAHARQGSNISSSQWEQFAHKWRQGIYMYRHAAVERGKYFSPETIYLRTLEELVRTESIDEGWDEAQMRLISESWAGQGPWSDTLGGIGFLKQKYIV